MPPKTVATVFCADQEPDAWKDAERRCEQCSAPFLPVRSAQRFCRDECRMAWWTEHQSMELHRCRCGRACAGPDPNRCRRPHCDGALVRDRDGATVCLFCARPGEPLELPEPDRRRPRLLGAAKAER